jgi:hypothetical protein
MDQVPLVIEQIEAGTKFLGEFQKNLPIQAAFWLKETEEVESSLYVVSDQITDDNFDVAYGEVLRISGELRDPWFDPFQVKLIGTNDPLADAVLDVQRRFPGRTPTRFRSKIFGGVSVDEVYVYPSLMPVPTQ